MNILASSALAMVSSVSGSSPMESKNSPRLVTMAQRRVGILGLLPVCRPQRTDQLRQFAHHDNRGDPNFMVPLIHHNGAEAGGVVDRARVLVEESSLLGVVVPEVHQLWRRRGSPGKGDSSTMATQ